MIFECVLIKYHAMKKILAIFVTIIILSSCATTRESKIERSELRNEKQLAEQAVIKKAVDSRRFIIKLDRMYLSRGGNIDLVPRANYIIIDGDKAIISAAYIGRQYTSRPIAGISMRGKALNYELTNELSKGIYDIKMEVSNGKNTFDVYLQIGKNGFCSASLSTLKIDYARYSGRIVPIDDQTELQVKNGVSI